MKQSKCVKGTKDRCKKHYIVMHDVFTLRWKNCEQPLNILVFANDLPTKARFARMTNNCASWVSSE